jgi:hypothetical protein
VKVGGAEIVICVAVVVAMVVRGRHAVIVILAQKPGADEVDAQPERRKRDRLPERDGHRPEQACKAFVADEEGDHRKNDGAGKGGKVAEFTDTEGEAVIARMAACIGVGEGAMTLSATDPDSSCA